jgi:cbb3-type cytochrome oxidase subunit 3
MLFNIVILFMVASIAWVLWTERKSQQALDKDALD